MRTSDLLADAFGRIGDGVRRVLDGLGDDALVWRPDPTANTVAWLVWHLARGQDAQVAACAGTAQVWDADGWADRFDLPFAPGETGYGQTPEEVAQVVAPRELLQGYLDAVQERSLAYVGTLSDDDLDRVVDDAWDPPVTLGVRLVSIVGDDLAHLGQAGYVKGLWGRR
ncbi:mycothiol transferase [Luteimicrobium subarcticum]|uniref:Uncharacterized protein DUF664 n=1 Tax=Luteimicrobium subarcticum TaxID=620910 RepID=A0A2M8W1J2_9MICO|nr:DinB family protein [Luteimicrobium subarcticum]PJI84802.1 uncharacterized protein DUF664 [Luteimicrobium subarcticum]